MKRNGLFLIVALLSVFCVTSCIEGNNVQEGQAIGVLTYGDGYTPILKSSLGPVYAPNIITMLDNGKMKMYGCYIFSYTLDTDLPENSQSVINANGYYTVTLNAFNELPQYTVDPYLVDTSKVVSDEFAVTSVYEEGSFLEGFLFISQIVEQPSDLELEWSMSYDYNTMMPSEDLDGRNYYDLFVRASKKNSSDKSLVSMQYLNAYKIGNYLQSAASREKALLGSSYNESSSKLTLRFNYVYSIDKETQNITWKTHTIDVLISSFLDY